MKILISMLLNIWASIEAILFLYCLLYKIYIYDILVDPFISALVRLSYKNQQICPYLVCSIDGADLTLFSRFHAESKYKESTKVSKRKTLIKRSSE